MFNLLFLLISYLNNCVSYNLVTFFITLHENFSYYIFVKIFIFNMHYCLMKIRVKTFIYWNFFNSKLFKG